jgi:transcription elongation factor GreA
MAETFPMTPAGKDALYRELRQIKEVDRPENVRDIEVAREHGDLRENAEFHAAKERQAALEGRMRYLEYRISNAQVIDPATIKSDRVGFGATVTVLDLDTDEEQTFTLVGEDESDADKGRISITSPIARALLGKQEGDEVVLKLPKGDRELALVSVGYKPLPSSD